MAPGPVPEVGARRLVRSGVHRRYVPYLRLTARRSPLGMVFALLSAGFEVASLAALGKSATGDYPTVSAAIPLSAAIAGALALMGVTRALSERQYALMQVELDAALRAAVTDAILTADWEDFVDQPGHELQSAAVSEAPAIAQAASLHARARSAVAGAVCVFVATVAISPQTALITLAFGAVIVVTYRRSSRGLGAVQSQMADSNAAMTRDTAILVNGLRSLRLSPVRETWRSRMTERFTEHARIRGADLLTPVLSRLLVDLLIAVMLLAVLLTQVALQQSLVAGLVVMALILRVVPRVQAAQQLSAYAEHGVEWVDRWERRLSVMPADVAVGSASSPTEADGAVLTVDGVGFGYRSHDRPVLQDVSLRVGPGEWVALLGPSGGGKSTLIDLVAGLLRPTSGRIQLLGKDVSSYADDERGGLLVVVPQDVQLLGGTVREVVSWDGLRPVSDDAADAALRAMGVDDMFQFSTASGVDAEVDEMSRNISGGMRTRLAMARALAGRPALLILDETTSRLHPAAEADMFSAIRGLMPELAVLVVTHRAETAALVDRVVRLEDGRVHQQLPGGAR